MPGPDRPDNGGGGHHYPNNEASGTRGLLEMERQGQAACWGSNTSDMRARADLAVGMGHPVGCWLEETGGDQRSVGEWRG